ncbi:hypothetical protein Caka_1833 [Coraliomargarita akajimensis DSM 45221]|uniref:Uncharacterized protein n=1 Tax=Coraliomargarita akajimensis (strain DSM 45221 / IAM 15411 / JCM 23193 / KCTC 12865 / 04OKA010-24) TaxID=583355 RepID=D5EKA2_CORAD|nr:hypothetical protein Caka_1833 [Coraliomargarita akajimensis DSM 45221]
MLNGKLATDELRIRKESGAHPVSLPVIQLTNTR